jgi:hypothetical protein
VFVGGAVGSCHRGAGLGSQGVAPWRRRRSFIAIYAVVDAWVLGVTMTALSALFNSLIVWIVAAGSG